MLSILEQRGLGKPGRLSPWASQCVKHCLYVLLQRLLS